MLTVVLSEPPAPRNHFSDDASHQTFNQNRTPRRISDIADHLKSAVLRGDKELSIEDFPWSTHEMRALKGIAEYAGVERVYFSLDCTEPGLPRAWRVAEEDMRRDVNLSQTAILRPTFDCVPVADLSDVAFSGTPLPPFMYPRSDRAHDAFVPKSMPFRDRVSCVSFGEADGVRKRAGWSHDDAHTRTRTRLPSPTFSVPLTKDDLPKLRDEYLLSSDDDDDQRHRAQRFMMCFENSASTGHVYFVDPETLNVWRRSDAPRDACLSGSIFDVECFCGNIVIRDVLLLSDVDQRGIANISTRLLAASDAVQKMTRAWGDFRVQTKAYNPVQNAGFVDPIIEFTTHLTFVPRHSQYVSGHDVRTFHWTHPDHVPLTARFPVDERMRASAGVPDEIRSGTIVECVAAGRRSDAWTFVRVSTDQTPMHRKSVERFANAFAHPISPDDLLSSASETR